MKQIKDAVQTWSMRILGSGEITVLPEKSTLLPDKLPRKRPCFPFSLWTKPLVFFLGCMLRGIPDVSELYNKATLNQTECLGFKDEHLYFNKLHPSFEFLIIMQTEGWKIAVPNLFNLAYIELLDHVLVIHWATREILKYSQFLIFCLTV